MGQAWVRLGWGELHFGLRWPTGTHPSRDSIESLQRLYRVSVTVKDQIPGLLDKDTLDTKDVSM